MRDECQKLTGQDTGARLSGGYAGANSPDSACRVLAIASKARTSQAPRSTCPAQQSGTSAGAGGQTGAGGVLAAGT